MDGREEERGIDVAESVGSSVRCGFKLPDVTDDALEPAARPAIGAEVGLINNGCNPARKTRMDQ